MKQFVSFSGAALGNPPANGIKFFATADLLESTKDRNWLVRVSATIYQHWHKQNALKKTRARNGNVVSEGVALVDG